MFTQTYWGSIGHPQNGVVPFAGLATGMSWYQVLLVTNPWKNKKECLSKKW